MLHQHYQQVWRGQSLPPAACAGAPAQLEFQQGKAASRCVTGDRTPHHKSRMTLGKPFNLPPPAFLTTPLSPSSYLSPAFLASRDRSTSHRLLSSWGASGEEVESLLVPPIISATERVTFESGDASSEVSSTQLWQRVVFFSRLPSLPQHAEQDGSLIKWRAALSLLIALT